MDPRVYIASELKNADLVYRLMLMFKKIHFTARWPLMHQKIPDDSDFAEHFWIDDYNDISRSAVVLVWAQQDEKLRGALVEAGIGIALQKRVIVIGTHPDYGTWQYHPGVERWLDDTLQSACDRLLSEQARGGIW